MESMEFRLTETEVRVLGSLIEKDITTPEYYPLSLNALVNACNQKSNRDPAMQLDEDAVRDALDGLQGQRMAGPAIRCRCKPSSASPTASSFNCITGSRFDFWLHAFTSAFIDSG